MNMNREAKWMCENSKELERFAGQWVLFTPGQGIVGCAHSLKVALAKVNKHQHREKPYMFHVPTSKELGFPFPVSRIAR